MILDGYCGAGGWDEGARVLGLGGIVGMDIWADACRTGKAAGHARIQADVSTYPTAPFVGRVRALLKSPPCQSFTQAGKREGETDRPQVHELVDRMARGDDDWQSMTWADPRSHHTAQPVRWVRDLRPEFVCLEQVPEVLPLWKHIGRVLTGWGYSVWAGKLCAADYGVPQTRTRAVLIASRVRRVAPPVATHYDPRRGTAMFGAPWVSMAEALGWVGTVRTGQNSLLSRAGDTAPYVRSADRPALTVMGNADRWTLTNAQDNATARTLDEPAGTVFCSRPGNLRWVLNTNRDQRPDGTRQTVDVTDLPAPTLTGKSGGQWTVDRPATTVAGDPRIAAPGHRDRAGGELQHAESLRVSVAEAAVLQSFRPDYPWQGNKTSQFLQIGNAVPPVLAAAVIGAATGIAFSAEAVAA